MSRMELDPNKKMMLNRREDVETRPIKSSDQSAGVLEEEHVFSTEEIDETQKQFWERKKLSKTRHKVDEAGIRIDAITKNNVDHYTIFTRELRRTNQILLEQSRDPILLELKQKYRKKNNLRKYFNRTFGINTIRTTWTE